MGISSCAFQVKRFKIHSQSMCPSLMVFHTSHLSSSILHSQKPKICIQSMQTSMVAPQSGHHFFLEAALITLTAKIRIQS